MNLRLGPSGPTLLIRAPNVHIVPPSRVTSIGGSGDVFDFVGRIGATPASPQWKLRLDFDKDSLLSVTADVFQFVGRIGDKCN